jgi:acylpyruvate hydrolase
MRIAMIQKNRVSGIGLWQHDRLHAYLESDSAYPGSLDAWLEQGRSLTELGAILATAPDMDPTGLRFLPPLARPAKILCSGLNYRDHAAEIGMAVPEWPAIFARFATCLVGHNEAIIRPIVSEQLDYEGELAVIIGKRCCSINESEALSHIAGYAIFNDATVRDWQTKSTQWTLGKNFSATGSFGPYLISPDELPPGAAGLQVRTRLNGLCMQHGNTSNMVFGVAKLLSILSQAMTLEPGDVIITGTPAGVGYSRKPPVFLQPGDTIEVEIEGIGTLSNTVAQGA